jgi:hypothetical protein
MFNGNTAAVLPAAALGSGNPGCGPDVARTTTPGGPRTIQGREVPFPMHDPYGPVNKAGVPVPGYNEWPPRANVMGKTFYGLSGQAAALRQKRAQSEDRGLSGFSIFDGGGAFSDTGFLPGTPGLGSGLPGGGGSSIWQSILSTIQSTLPATISAIKKQPYYPPGYGIQQPGGGVVYGADGSIVSTGSAAASGAQLGAGLANVGNSLSSFVAANPLLVLGGAVALFLLFKEPPRRR